jgi:hypothetical protein
MVDLQRSMGCIWNIARPRIQAGRKNSDTDALMVSISSGKFSGLDSGKNFIRADLS